MVEPCGVREVAQGCLEYQPAKATVAPHGCPGAAHGPVFGQGALLLGSLTWGWVATGI